MSGILDFLRSAGHDPYRAALDAEYKNDFARAAEIYAGMAAEEADQNALICAGSCGDAAVAYLKAGNPAKAREQEKNAIQALNADHYLKGEGNRLDILLETICKMHDEGFAQEAAFFAAQINETLTANRCPLRIGVEAAKTKIVECPHCGASFKATIGTDTNCPYCACTVNL